MQWGDEAFCSELQAEAGCEALDLRRAFLRGALPQVCTWGY